MTLDEQAKVDALCRKLFPDDAPTLDKPCSSRCPSCKLQHGVWNAQLWETYRALMEVGLI